MQIINANEPIATERLLPLFLEDVAGNPVTGQSRGGTAVVIQILKEGGAWANSTNDIVDVGNGFYELQLTVAEVSSPGQLYLRCIKTANFKDFNDQHTVKAVTDCLFYDVAAGGSTTFVTLGARGVATDSYYCGAGKDCLVSVVAGAGAGQFGLGVSYAGASTKRITFKDALAIALDPTSVIKIHPYSGQLDAATITAIQATLATVANQATMIAALAAINADTDDIQTRLPAALDGGFMKAQVKGIDAGQLTAIGGAVWDLALAGHATAGSFGELLAILAALHNQNSRVDQTVYTNGLLVSARVRTFANAAAANASDPAHANTTDGEIYRFAITAVDDGSGKFTSYLMTRTL